MQFIIAIIGVIWLISTINSCGKDEETIRREAQEEKARIAANQAAYERVKREREETAKALMEADAAIAATLFASPDGYNWTEFQTPVDEVDYRSAVWNGQRLLVAGGMPWWYWWVGTPSFERPVGLSITDGGETWQIFNIDGFYQSNGMAWGNGRFVSVGQATPASGEGAIYTWD